MYLKRAAIWTHYMSHSFYGILPQNFLHIQIPNAQLRVTFTLQIITKIKLLQLTKKLYQVYVKRHYKNHKFSDS